VPIVFPLIEINPSHLTITDQMQAIPIKRRGCFFTVGKGRIGVRKKEEMINGP